jgi:glycine/D-amino acid oxidase-like deaminating enzyme
MSEFTISPNPRKALGDRTVSSDRLHIIGCIGLWSNALGRFPLPLYAIDGDPLITKFPKHTRVQGVLPSDWEEGHLIEASWTGQVDLEGDVPYGEGNVYLGNATTPSDTWGIVLAKSVAYDPQKVLNLLPEADQRDILYIRQHEGNAVSYLVYK